MTDYPTEDQDQSRSVTASMLTKNLEVPSDIKKIMAKSSITDWKMTIFNDRTFKCDYS